MSPTRALLLSPSPTQEKIIELNQKPKLRLRSHVLSCYYPFILLFYQFPHIPIHNWNCMSKGNQNVAQQGRPAVYQVEWNGVLPWAWTAYNTWFFSSATTALAHDTGYHPGFFSIHSVSHFLKTTCLNVSLVHTSASCSSPRVKHITWG